MATRMVYLHALTPLHPGTGQAAGVVDLPVARRKVPGWPYVPSSSLKGILRDACEGAQEADQALIGQAFGSADSERGGEDRAGALTFTDAQLLCLPVRSYYGSFAWLTCPLALRLWARDRQRVDNGYALPELPALAEGQIAVPAADSALIAENTVYLEDYDLAASAHQGVATLGTEIGQAVFGDDPIWQGEFLARFGVVHNDLFTFLTETATEVVARIKIQDDTKTVQSGGLWYEELLPTETIFACPILADQRKGGATPEALLALIDRQVVKADATARALQIGGKASIGRGLVTLRLV